MHDLSSREGERTVNGWILSRTLRSKRVDDST